MSDLATTCRRCGVVHVKLASGIEVRDPDDEVVAHGFVHIERLSDEEVWVGLTAPDGSDVSVYLTGEFGGRILMRTEP